MFICSLPRFSAPVGFLDRDLDGTVPQCVPHSEWMNAHIKPAAHILNNRTANKTEFLAFAAYDYSNYSMVTTTADGHYG